MMDCDCFLRVRHRRSNACLTSICVAVILRVLELHLDAFLFQHDYAIKFSFVFYYQDMFAIRSPRTRQKKRLIYLWRELPCRLPAFVKPAPRAALATQRTRAPFFARTALWHSIRRQTYAKPSHEEWPSMKNVSYENRKKRRRVHDERQSSESGRRCVITLYLLQVAFAW